MTAIELAGKFQELNPGKLFAVSKSGYCVGLWNDEVGRYLVVAGQLIGSDKWLIEPLEVLVNGQPVVAADDWIPCITVPVAA